MEEQITNCRESRSSEKRTFNICPENVDGTPVEYKVNSVDGEVGINAVQELKKITEKKPIKKGFRGYKGSKY